MLNPSESLPDHVVLFVQPPDVNDAQFLVQAEPPKPIKQPKPKFSWWKVAFLIICCVWIAAFFFLHDYFSQTTMEMSLAPKEMRLLQRSVFFEGSRIFLQDSQDGGLVAFKFEMKPELSTLKFEIILEEDIELKDRYLRSWSRYFVQNSTVIFSLVNEPDYSICILAEQEYLSLADMEYSCERHDIRINWTSPVDGKYYFVLQFVGIAGNSSISTTKMLFSVSLTAYDTILASDYYLGSFKDDYSEVNDWLLLHNPTEKFIEKIFIEYQKSNLYFWLVFALGLIAQFWSYVLIAYIVYRKMNRNGEDAKISSGLKLLIENQNKKGPNKIEYDSISYDPYKRRRLG